jgi:hypothetical protein
MGKNSKPILSVLVDEEKKERFADLARRNKYSMGWLLNDCIDRMLQADSISIYRDSTGDTENSLNTQPDNNTGTNIEELVKSYVDNYLNTSSIGSQLSSSPTPSREDIEEMINTSIGNADIDKLVKPSIGVSDVERIVNTSIGIAIEPITKTITELETYTRGRFEELEPRSIATVTPTKDKDPSTKTWVEFFKMVGIDALTASEAQKKENIDTRTKQIEAGVLAAKDKGLGEWAVKVAGRSFVRVAN